MNPTTSADRSAKAKAAWETRRANAAAKAAETGPRDAFGTAAPIVNKPRKTSRGLDRVGGQALSLDGEVVNRRRTLGDEGIVNPFDIPAHLQHPEFVTRGVSTSVYGQPDVHNYNAALAGGWRPCKVKHFPGCFPDLEVKGPDTIIERDGITLMHRHRSLEDEALAEQHRDALRLREGTAEMFGDRKLAKGFEKGKRSADGKFDASTKIVRSREASPIDAKPKYTYAGPDED